MIVEMRDLVDVDPLARDEVQKKVYRTLEHLQLDLVRHDLSAASSG